MQRSGLRVDGAQTIPAAIGRPIRADKPSQSAVTCTSPAKVFSTQPAGTRARKVQPPATSPPPTTAQRTALPLPSAPIQLTMASSHSKNPKKRKSSKPASEYCSPLPPSAASGTASISLLKRKIRDLTRLLARTNPSASDSSHGSLPSTVRQQNERALEAYKHELALAQKAQKENRMRDRYRMVRFFERQKATRKLRQVERDFNSNSNPSQKDNDRLLAARVDLSYTLYFPLDRKYISLYKSSAADPKTEKMKEDIRADIRARMLAGTLGKRTMIDQQIEDEEQSGRSNDEGSQDQSNNQSGASQTEKNSTSTKQKGERKEKKSKGKVGSQTIRKRTSSTNDEEHDDFFTF
ncbi:hypothetical protein BDZ91DRAFT_840726 [Kalaharituber pfeilii]|nr:hypothetical protein BDZ91DRAFT_840726 [Kalaharituber pfeilii]